jgi:hypothetical protein
MTLHYLSWKLMNVLATFDKDVNSVMTIKHSPIRPSLQ